MSAHILDGKAISHTLKEQLRARVSARKQAGLRVPGLAVIQVGSDPASGIYVRNKRQTCQSLGIASEAYDFPDSISQATLLSLIDQLNETPSVDGILVQSPLPSHINSQEIYERIHPNKDVDGFHPYNLGRLAQRRPTLRPCTPLGIMRLLASIPYKVQGKQATVIGVSNIVGRPMILELLMAGATITACHRHTQDLKTLVSMADLLVVATGNPHLIPGEWIKPGSVVIDVGMNRTETGKLVGDVDFNTAQERAGWITPVPGGVGPMTIACLMENTLLAQELAENPSSAHTEGWRRS